MLTSGQIEAIVDYERRLSPGGGRRWPPPPPPGHRPRRHRLGSRDPQHPHRHRRHRRADRLGLPDRRHQRRARTGLLVALCALFGWMATMGVIWWIYGIGMKGAASPSWQVEEVKSSDDFSDGSRSDLEDATTSPPGRPADGSGADRGGPDDRRGDPAARAVRPGTRRRSRAEDLHHDRPDPRGPPRAAEQYDIEAPRRLDPAAGLRPPARRRRRPADAFLGPDGPGLFEAPPTTSSLTCSASAASPLPEDDLPRPGEAQAVHDLPVPHPPPLRRRAGAGRRAPGDRARRGRRPPVLDEDAPVISVIMVRDLGDKRFPAAWSRHRLRILFGLSTLDAAPARQPPSPGCRGRLTSMDDYLPLVTLLVLAVLLP